jgi:hypothetical protein
MSRLRRKIYDYNSLPGFEDKVATVMEAWVQAYFTYVFTRRMFFLSCLKRLLLGLTPVWVAEDDSSAVELSLSLNARVVFKALWHTPQGNDGLSLERLMECTSMERQRIIDATDELLNWGLIFSTVDDETWVVVQF